MRIVALLAVRNEELYLPTCLKHLYEQGIETCVIDNGSTDKSREIAGSFKGRGVFRIDDMPYDGQFELEKILKYEEMLASEINADWFMHHDADEIREAPNPYRTLLEGIEAVDRQGYNAVNFDEFVFTPTENDGSYENRDYVKEMKYYYFYEMGPLTQIKAWKKSAVPFSLAASGGHQANFEGRKIFPENFILRHYIALSRHHLIEKYSKRAYSQKEVGERGWHKDRASFDPLKIALPKKEQLKEISNKGFWDKSDPYNKHTFLGFTE